MTSNNKDELTTLKDELLNLIDVKEDMLSHRLYELRNRYIMEFGTLEARLHELSVLIEQAKRRIDLTQLAMRFSNVIDEEWIETQLENEFAENLDKIEAEYNIIEYAEKDLNKQKRTRSLLGIKRRKYRRLISGLHPDLHPDLSSEQRRLLRQIVNAYREGDWERFDKLSKGAKPSPSGDPSEDSLRGRIATLQQQLLELQDEFPFNQEDIITDARLRERRRSELISEVEKSEEILQAWLNRYQQIRSQKFAGEYKN